MAGAANSPARGAGESLVEFMSRFLEAYGVGSAEREDEDIPMSRRSLFPRQNLILFSSF
jgi:hypothetical protein